MSGGIRVGKTCREKQENAANGEIQVGKKYSEKQEKAMCGEIRVGKKISAILPQINGHS